MATESRQDAHYLIGDSQEERKRLTAQSRILYPFTRQVFERAGIQPGMRVLDVGSGMGDVCLLLAELVGPTGSVVGVDRNADILEQARQRVPANVTLHAGDIRTITLDQEFDAVVGRAVLMYQADPVETMVAAARAVRPGGIVAFIEVDFTTGGGISVPQSPLQAKTWGWVVESFRRAGVEIHMGFKLRDTFLTAALPEPSFQANPIMGGAPGWEGYQYAEDTFRSLLPSIELYGLATREEVDVDTLAERLEAEIVSSNASIMLATWVGAWTRKP
jgi:ubiquinone/menaquinone biosynthesis C-methylase UbiE